jgi:AraC-like DNA-binding protein
VNRRYNESLNDSEKQWCVVSFMRSGDIYFKEGNFLSAFDQYSQGLIACESCNDKRHLAELYKDLGNVYCISSDYEMGINYFNHALELSRQKGDKKLEYSIITNLAGTYNLLKNVKMAKKYYKLSLAMTPKGDILKNYLNMLELGFIQENEKKYDKALKTIKQSMDYAIKHKMELRYVGSAADEIYNLYGEMGQRDSMFHYMKICNKIARKAGMNDVLINNLKAFSKYYEEQGDKQKALFYKAESLALTDSIFNQREFSRMKHLQFQYEVNKSEKKISQLNKDKQDKDMRLRSLAKITLVVLLALIVISVFFIVVYRQKKKLMMAYKNLYDINIEIMNSGLHNRTARQLLEEELKKKDKELERYKTLMESGAENNADMQKEDGMQMTNIPDDEAEKSNSADDISKNQASKLSDEQKTALLNDIMRIMETTTEYCEMDFSLSKLASLVNSNRQYVSSIINEKYHKNFNNFVNEYRIQEARSRLTNIEAYGNYTIQGIAESLGYKSSTTFTNAFKSLTGLTPSAFQRLARENSN